MNFTDISVRTLVSFLVLLFMTRILGKTQLSHLTFFNYITGITIGNIAATVAVDRSIQLGDGILSIVGWSLLSVAAGYVSLKSSKARIIFNGEPTIVIKNGQILEKALRQIKMTMDDLKMLLRTKDVHSIADVDHAILEPNGQLTVIKKPEKQSITKQDMNIMTIQPSYIPTGIIVDGNIIYRNLSEINLSIQWLENQLKQTGLDLRDVFYAEIQSDGSLYIDKRKDT